MESRDTKGMVRIIWVDCAGIRRCRVVRRSRLLQAERFGIGLGFACHFLPCWGDVPPPDPVAAPVGEMRLMPDVSTMKSLPWRPNDAMVLVTMNNEPGEPWECCPRSALANAQDLLKKELGVCLAVGFELEFVLMKKDASSIGAPQPIDQTVYCATSAFEGAADVLQDICDGLEAIGQIVEQASLCTFGARFNLSKPFCADHVEV
jgi:glutamine synthetase